MVKKTKTTKHGSSALLENLNTYDPLKERNVRKPFSEDVQVVGMPAAADTKEDVLIITAPGTSEEVIVKVRRSDVARVVGLPAIMDPLTNELLPQVKLSIRAGSVFSVTRLLRAGEPAEGYEDYGDYKAYRRCRCRRRRTHYINELPLVPIPTYDDLYR